MSRQRVRRLCRRVILLFLAAAFTVALLQLWAHRTPSFFPDYPREDLSTVLAKAALSPADYTLLLAQTGLGKPAVDLLRATDPAAIPARQEAFFTPRKVDCMVLFPPFIREDHMKDPETGAPFFGPLPAALREGDLLLTLDTHALGWRHGHAGIVVDAREGIVLEAVGVGTTAILRSLDHWREYRSYMVFRYSGSGELAGNAAEYARDRLAGRPYTLFSGLRGDKFAPLEEVGAQCAYLVWYAYMAQGVDLDSDGGRLVTVYDLARSSQLELVEFYGTDPEAWS